LKDWEDLVSRVPRTEKIVVGADLNGHMGINPGVFQRNRLWPKEQRRGENLGKHGEPRLGTSEHFLQQKRRASNHL
jgi:hypothetical protein